MKRNIIVLLGGLFFLIVVGIIFIVSSQIPETSRTYKIGILVRGEGYDPAVAGYLKKMKEIRYEEGKNVLYDIRYVSAKEDLPKAAQECVEAKVDLIHTYSTPATQAVYNATKNLLDPIPVVFGSMGDPLASGTVKGIQSSGTNVTGVASLSTELTAKRLELIKELFPAAKKVAMPHTAKEAGDRAADISVDIALETAEKLGMEIIPFPVKDKADNARAAKLIKKGDVEGMIVGGDSLIWGSIQDYINQAIEEKLPLAAFDISQVKKGALVGYGPDYAISGEQSAVLTDKILKGRLPAELPIEVPQKLILVFNDKTAKLIGFTVSSDFLAKVDIFIEE